MDMQIHEHTAQSSEQNKRRMFKTNEQMKEDLGVQLHELYK